MFNIKILTPVHVGVSNEKNLAKGLDFVTKKGRLYLLDTAKLLKRIPAYQLANEAEKNNGFLKILEENKIVFEDVSSSVIQSKSLHGWEIKSQIKTGLGYPYLPGSSIKGALRSMLLHHYQKEKNEAKNADLDFIFGSIENSILKFLRVQDLHFSKHGFYNTAIMSLKENEREGWKKKWNINVNNFSEHGMNIIYETLLPGDQTKAHIEFKDMLHQQYERNKTPNNFSEILSPDFSSNLIKHIRTYTNTHLDREINFVNKYFEASKDKVLEVFEWLKHQNNLDHAAVLRVGAGVGFHSITGDWQYRDHTDTGLWKKPAMHGKKKYKTRKFAFTYVEGDYKLWPMGFILLSKSDVEIEFPEGLIQEKKILKSVSKSGIDSTLAKSSSQYKEQQPRFQSELTTKIKYRKFKPGDKVTAIGTGRKKGLRNTVVKLYIEGYENKEYDFRYPAGINKETFVEVDVKSVTKKGEINQVAFSKFL
ncbi:type III-A CRISPR-associated RAMP protein Csm5 [Membranicola marinus]|uniref:CRISPR system Cms protein Csm5 n=1 Tax=Membranihabitans marinus TaxID=1227546 RepID=A0A953I1X1_9BACT|nr:type III-A CRISPR-associated RAMP protein Csm5 [Membranihabitans marinus]MBY5959777.1 type III-A CRISPR-associated RAMP protein Csm5 [Membranihabitans marinus]